jgi:hypothetical protein
MRPPWLVLAEWVRRRETTEIKTGMDMRLNGHDNTTRISAELMYPSRPSRRAVSQKIDLRRQFGRGLSIVRVTHEPPDPDDEPGPARPYVEI